MNNIKPPSIAWHTIPQLTTDNAEQYIFNYMDKHYTGAWIVYLRYKYTNDKQWSYSFESVELDYTNHCLCWFNDWYEGQQDVEYIAITKISE